MSYPPPPQEPGTPDEGGQRPGSPSEPTAPYPGAAGQPPYGEPPYGEPPYGQGPYGSPTYGYGQPGQQPGYPPPGYGYPTAPSNGKATASLIVGIATLVLSWCCGAGVLGIVAIVLGVRARGEIQASQGRQTGEGMAVAGIVTGVLAVLVGLASLAVIIIAVVSGGYSGNYRY